MFCVCGREIMSAILIILMVLFVVIQVVYPLNEYVTPAEDDKFSEFQITDSIHSNGSNGGGPKQPAINFSNFSREFITFNFKGEGHAQLFFQEDVSITNKSAFTLEIGGGTNNDQVTIYKFKLGTIKANAMINGITSDKEFRSFWIKLNTGGQTVSMGFCNEPGSDQILEVTNDHFNFNVNHISLSTTSANSGQWQFASDGEMLGGCQNSNSNGPGGGNNGVQVACENGSNCVSSTNNVLYGTCAESGNKIPEGGFGTGVCRTACGGEVKCWTNETCENDTCVAITTTTVMTTTTPTITTTPANTIASTPPTNSISTMTILLSTPQSSLSTLTSPTVSTAASVPTTTTSTTVTTTTATTTTTPIITTTPATTIPSTAPTASISTTTILLSTPQSSVSTLTSPTVSSAASMTTMTTSTTEASLTTTISTAVTSNTAQPQTHTIKSSTETTTPLFSILTAATTLLSTHSAFTELPQEGVTDRGTIVGAAVGGTVGFVALGAGMFMVLAKTVCNRVSPFGNKGTTDEESDDERDAADNRPASTEELIRGNGTRSPISLVDLPVGRSHAVR